MTTTRELGLLRLVAQGIAGPPRPTPADAVRGLTAVQAQDYPGALTSVALRTAGRLRSDVEAALDAGTVVRSWPMRGTLHLVAAEDLGWLLDLLTPRARSAAAGRHQRLGLTAADLERAGSAAVGALHGGRRRRRHRTAGLPPPLAPRADRRPLPRPDRRGAATVRPARRMGARRPPEGSGRRARRTGAALLHRARSRDGPGPRALGRADPRERPGRPHEGAIRARRHRRGRRRVPPGAGDR